MLKENPHGILMLDRELKQRTFVDEIKQM